jgi:hypothetical protein
VIITTTKSPPTWPCNAMPGRARRTDGIALPVAPGDFHLRLQAYLTALAVTFRSTISCGVSRSWSAVCASLLIQCPDLERMAEDFTHAANLGWRHDRRSLRAVAATACRLWRWPDSSVAPQRDLQDPKERQGERRRAGHISGSCNQQP